MDKGPGKASSPTKTPKKSNSPYRAISRRNNNYCGYISISTLQPHKPYAMYKLDHTNQAVYGPGELAYVKNNKNIQHRVQLPGKYLKELSEKQVETMRSDIDKGSLPYLIYREILPDKSFHIDILPDVPEMKKYHQEWADVPDIAELDFLALDSSTESTQTKNTEDNADGPL